MIYILTLESVMEEWSKLVVNVVEQETSKRPKGKGPLAEIDFWRQRNAVLSALYEQINMQKVQNMLKVFTTYGGSMLHPFHVVFGELSKLYLEAKDNVKFLTTLEHLFHKMYLTVLSRQFLKFTINDERN